MSQEQPTAEELARLSKPVYAPRKQRRRPPDKNQGDLFADGGSNTKASQKGPGEGLAAEAARSAAVWSEHRTAAAAGGDGPLYLSSGHCCDETEGVDVGSVYRLRPIRCRRWFCRKCGIKQGWELRQKLLRSLESFPAVFGITLTLDGALFESPEQGWLYVMENRLLSRLVRELGSRGLLHTKAYFWSVEFQENTEQAHWHMLLDTSHIPYGVLVEIWSRFRPSFAPPLEEPITAENYKGRPPAFGSVFFSPPRDRLKAACYATKYLTKYPKQGYPAWVLKRVGRMPRFGHSHRFFPRTVKHEPGCFCDVCRGEAEPPPRPKQPKKSSEENRTKRRESRTTIGQRVGQCEKEVSILQVRQIMLPDGTITDGATKFDGKLELPIEEACEYLGVDPKTHWELSLRGEEVTELEEFSGQRPPSKGAA